MAATTLVTTVPPICGTGTIGHCDDSPIQNAAITCCLDNAGNLGKIGAATVAMTSVFEFESPGYCIHGGHIIQAELEDAGIFLFFFQFLTSHVSSLMHLHIDSKSKRSQYTRVCECCWRSNSGTSLIALELQDRYEAKVCRNAVGAVNDSALFELDQYLHVDREY